ncbi:BTB/POZ domain-containing protein SETH6 [Capsicum chinense]|nr:BTB/POZ domain-containing protein SETH6 [Capsicum chinense]
MGSKGSLAYTVLVCKTGPYVVPQTSLVPRRERWYNPPYSFSLVLQNGRIRKLLLEAKDTKVSRINLIGLPGGSDAFELAAKFCYGVNIKITISNVVLLRCATRFMEITEYTSKKNLEIRTKVFLKDAVFPNISNSISILHRCETLLPVSEEVNLVSRLINAIANNACKEQLTSGLSKLEYNFLPKPVQCVDSETPSDQTEKTKDHCRNNSWLTTNTIQDKRSVNGFFSSLLKSAIAASTSCKSDLERRIEVVLDLNLTTSKYIALAGLLPDYAHLVYNGLYRAVDIFLKVTTYEKDHSCSVDFITSDHRNAISKVICDYILELMHGSSNVIRLNFVVDEMKRKYGIIISYNKGGRAIQHAYTVIRGTAKEKYNRLPSYIHIMKVNNPGTYTNIKRDDENRYEVAIGEKVRRLSSYSVCLYSASGDNCLDEHIFLQDTSGWMSIILWGIRKLMNYIKDKYARRGEGQIDNRQILVGLCDSSALRRHSISQLSNSSGPPRLWRVAVAPEIGFLSSNYQFRLAFIKEKPFMPPRRTNINAQEYEVRPTHGMRTHNRAHTSEPVPTLRVPPVLTSPPRAPWTNVNRPPTTQRDISNAEFR